MWEPRLLTGAYKVMESDHKFGPDWTDCETQDDGSIIVRKRYLHITRKDGALAITQILG